MPRAAQLTPAQQDALIEMRRRHPHWGYAVIGQKFGVTAQIARNILNPETRQLPKRPAAAAPKDIPAPACTVRDGDSFLRPIPISLLMGGAPRRAKLQPAQPSVSPLHARP